LSDLIVFLTQQDPKVTTAIQNACYGYFLLGGLAVEGPMGLLSGYVHLQRNKRKTDS
jgi:hypothetical protein